MINTFEVAKEYKYNVHGKTFRCLNKEELENVVIFLDIDETLGSIIGAPSRIAKKEELLGKDLSQLENRIIEVCTKPLCPNAFRFKYFTEGDDRVWYIVEAFFLFRSYLGELNRFFREKNMKEIYLFSAANREYVECIRRILINYYGFDIKNIFLANTYDKKIKIDLYRDTYYESVLADATYCPKDMWNVLEVLGHDDTKIPILFDDREYWGANGFTVRIICKNDISDFLDTPIQKSNGLLL